MRDIIRFAWGESSLGDVLVAVSTKGLVAFEFANQRPALAEALHARFPDAEIVNDENGLAQLVGTMAQLVEQPGLAPDIPLDLRGTPYEINVWQMLRDIPMGETTHYGALAALLGTRDARDVTKAIAANPIAILLPCHRVLRKDGSISGYRWGVYRKKALLQREKAAVAKYATARREAEHGVRSAA
ncbi:methylated-DNA--[protein]-cysteine S-methyltransferase [Bosea psychrotolerans]|uniref:AraC family transcriptional regulator of adaptative response/methylated-DNA-[protein]-cysteine methyltransferase n=1 Tax=Bosea psychrotolerans TaxID=1871628 RepID=A0A2S4LVL4_9HYPH|nr:methylated-DNA--[protein]-cysteine S-methyltransferase [Bosea psychrotolerans]POR46487.1 AraC family transcriptional regulator of adaptative response/methylated-DNA-[protein]-cysteine methyltransferase [Bosea psychrotolerans]